MTATIMMIHGMFCGGWAWENYKAFFEGKGYRCITPTLRYHNVAHDDPPHAQLGTTSLLDYAHDLEAEIRELDKPPILMGHSMGGLLVQILAARGVAEVLVLLTPAAPRGIMALKYTVIRSFWDQLTTYGFWKKPVKETMENAIYSTLHLVPPEKRKEIFDKFVYESGRAGWEMGFGFLTRTDLRRLMSRGLRALFSLLPELKTGLRRPLLYERSQPNTGQSRRIKNLQAMHIGYSASPDGKI